jgi:hypothetical protein
VDSSDSGYDDAEAAAADDSEALGYRRLTKQMKSLGRGPQETLCDFSLSHMNQTLPPYWREQHDSRYSFY